MIKRFNDWIALNVTLGMGTMWCVYAFCVIAMAPLAVPGLEQICIYVSTTIIQLVALPIILVGQNILGRKSELRAEQDHEAVMQILCDADALKDVNVRLAAIEKLLTSRLSA